MGISVQYKPSIWVLFGRTFDCTHTESHLEDIYDDIPSASGGMIENKFRVTVCDDCDMQLTDGCEI